MRRFRYLVQSAKEPTDHEVIWVRPEGLYYYNRSGWELLLASYQAITEEIGKPIKAERVTYSDSEDSSIENVEDALSALLYKAPAITSFSCNEQGILERGEPIGDRIFKWEYNKQMLTQSMNNTPLNRTLRECKVTAYSDKASKDESYTLVANDGKKSVTASVYIKVLDFIYFKSDKINGIKAYSKVSPNLKNLTLTVNAGEHAHIFIPKTAKLSKLVNNGVDSTEDFNVEPDYKFKTDYDIETEGAFYISKNNSLGAIVLNLE